MSVTNAGLRFARICHPSDFSEASNHAFAHALRLSVAAKSSLTILHTGPVREGDMWADFPRVRQTLERWKLLPPDSPKEAIPNLGLNIQKMLLPETDTVRSVVNYLERHPHDLIVLATHQHDGFQRWTQAEIAVPLARSAHEATLFLPHQTAGFVSEETGLPSLNHVLIPVDRVPDAQGAIDTADALLEVLGCSGTRITLLYVGDEARSPSVNCPEGETLDWRWMNRQGDVEEQILAAAADHHADLIVMATNGRHGFLDALRGSITERVVRHAACPVLAVPDYRPEAHRHSVAENLATGKLTW